MFVCPRPPERSSDSCKLLASLWQASGKPLSTNTTAGVNMYRKFHQRQERAPEISTPDSLPQLYKYFVNG